MNPLQQTYLGAWRASWEATALVPTHVIIAQEATTLVPAAAAPPTIPIIIAAVLVACNATLSYWAWIQIHQADIQNTRTVHAVRNQVRVMFKSVTQQMLAQLSLFVSRTKCM